MSEHQYEPLSCGACGCAEHRLLWERRQDGSVREVKAVCRGCGCVTHILPPTPSVRFAAGRAEEGENDAGLLCPMPWPDRAEEKTVIAKMQTVARTLRSKSQEAQDNGVDATSQQEEDRAFARSAALREAYVLVIGALPKDATNQVREDEK